MNTIKSIYFHNPTPVQLERTVCWLLAKGYRFVSADELYGIVANKHAVSGRLAFLSLDDAWRTNLRLVPVVEKYNVPITIFAPVEAIETGNYWWEYVPREEREGFKRLGYAEFCGRMAELRCRKTLKRSCMTADEIRRLAQNPLVSIQSHTLTHPILTSLPDGHLAYELAQSKQRLEAMTGCEVRYFSYPNGTYSCREVEAARLVYRMAFTTDLHYISGSDDILALPRIELTGRYHRDKLKFYNIWPVMRKIGCTILHKPCP